MVTEHEFATPAQPVEPASQRLTNADFRKLMMTPRASSSSTPFYEQSTPTHQRRDTRGKMDPSKAAERRKKKNFYAKMKKEEEDKMAELAAKYRDRASERRDGGESAATGAADETATAYRAVAPNARDNHDAAERRRQMIQESKYLGGDMEHTHLVKGLDFALLQKVRSEICSREAEMENTAVQANKDEKTEKEGEEETKIKEEEDEKKKEDPEVKIETRTIMAKNIVRNVFRPDTQKVNELFFPGRMAYVMELEEEVESDIPTTTIRSKKDVAINEQKATLSTNDIVINKLTQILSYLRAGSRNKKKKKDKLAMLDAVIKQEKDDMPIYDDINDYKPRKDEKRSRHDDRRDRRDDYKDRRDDDRRGGDRDRYRDRDRDRDFRDRKERDRDIREKYVGSSRDDRRDRRDRDDQPAERRSYFDTPADEGESEHKGGFSAEDKQMIKSLLKKEGAKEKAKEDAASLMSSDYGYAECYPGLMEMEDAIGDSDEETDYSKMDMGNKKGPVGRWDFDTPEEYSDYMSSREALPKAAFQYGMKMSDGRKTRGKIGQKNEKAKLDKEWNQISALIEKRKGGGGSGGSLPKKPKYD